MDSFVLFLCDYAHAAPWIIFLLLLLTGFSIPISEDLIIIFAGAIVSICLPEHYFMFYGVSFAGSLFAAWIAYGIGRFFGEKIYDMRWFKKFITRSRIKKLHHYYEKFGVLTFIAGRCFPGGVRNALFMTAGLGKMPFPIFVMRDSLACFISVTLLFNLGTFFGIHYKKVIHFIETYDMIAIAVLLLGLIMLLLIHSRFKNIKL